MRFAETHKLTFIALRQAYRALGELEYVTLVL